MIKIKALIFAIVIQCLSLPVWSSFEKGFELYQGKQFDEAFKVFRSLAEVGDYHAMRNLGVMYYRGEAVDRDPIQGYAWVDTAEKALGIEENRLAETILKELSADQKKQALLKAIALYEDFNPEAMSQRIFPTLLSDEECEQGPELINKKRPRYPRSAAQQGVMGQVMLDYLVTPEGYARDIELISASNKSLVKASGEAARYFRYEPSVDENKKSWPLKVLFTFAMQGDAKVKGLEKTLDTLSEWKIKAESGSAEDQYIYARFLDNVREMRGMIRKFHNSDSVTLRKQDQKKLKKFSEAVELEYQEANKWLMSSAKQGLSNAQYDLGLNMTQGRGCKTDADNGYRWIEASAVGGYSPAQYMMGEKMIEQSETTAIHWLRNAATANHYKAKLLLAWELSTSSIGELRDAKEALTLLEEKSDTYFDDVRVYETLAAAYAELGNFKKAVKYQKKAVKEAKRLDWELPVIDRRLATYQSKRPWRGHYMTI